MALNEDNGTLCECSKALVFQMANGELTLLRVHLRYERKPLHPAGLNTVNSGQAAVNSIHIPPEAR